MEINEIKSYIEERNAQTIAWVAEDPENRFGGTCDADSIIDELSRYTEVKTLDDYKRYELWICYYDGYKSAHGIKARWTTWQDYSLEGWERKLASLSEDIKERIALEEAAERRREEAKAQAEARIARAMDTSIGDNFIAVRLPL